MIYIVLLFSLLSAVAVGYLAAAVSYNVVLVIAVAVIAGLFAFFSPKLSLVLLIFSMLLSPEIGFGAVSAERSVILRYDDVLVVVMFFSWLARSALLKDKPFVIDTAVQRPIIVYTFICILSTAFGVLRGDVRFQTAFFYILKYVEYFLIYFMVVNIIDSKEEAKKYLKFGFWVAVIVTVYAYYYYANSGPGARAGAPFEAPIGRPQESEPASLGGYYLLVFGLIIAMMTEYSGSSLVLAMVSMVFMFPAFLITYSRASYGGFAAMVLFFFAGLNKRRLLLAVFMLLAVIAAGFMPGVYKNITSIGSAYSSARQMSKSGMDIDLYEQVKNRIEMTYRGNYATNTVALGMVGNLKLEESAAMRVRSIKRVLFEKLPKHPLLGWGVTGVGLGDTQYALLLGELGLVGFAVFIWMIYTIFSAAWKVYRAYNEPWIKALGFGLMASIAGLLLQAIAVNTFIIVRIMEPFWFLTALIMVLHRQTVPAKT